MDQKSPYSLPFGNFLTDREKGRKAVTPATIVAYCPQGSGAWPNKSHASQQSFLTRVSAHRVVTRLGMDVRSAAGGWGAVLDGIYDGAIEELVGLEKMLAEALAHIEAAEIAAANELRRWMDGSFQVSPSAALMSGMLAGIAATFHSVIAVAMRAANFLKLSQRLVCRRRRSIPVQTRACRGFACAPLPRPRPVLVVSTCAADSFFLLCTGSIGRNPLVRKP